MGRHNNGGSKIPRSDSLMKMEIAFWEEATKTGSEFSGILKNENYVRTQDKHQRRIQSISNQNFVFHFWNLQHFLSLSFKFRVLGFPWKHFQSFLSGIPGFPANFLTNKKVMVHQGKFINSTLQFAVDFSTWWFHKDVQMSHKTDSFGNSVRAAMLTTHFGSRWAAAAATKRGRTN